LRFHKRGRKIYRRCFRKKKKPPTEGKAERTWLAAEVCGRMHRKIPEKPLTLVSSKKGEKSVTLRGGKGKKGEIRELPPLEKSQFLCGKTNFCYILSKEEKTRPRCRYQ